ncbi:MAG TPA: hypothetical protein VIH59_13225, partial [Candidatus Tectomicrobia bacterium]
HEGIDRLYVALLHRLVPPVFRHGGPAPLLHEHLAAVQLQLPPLTAAPRYTLTAHTLVGTVEAGFRIRPGPRPTLPVLIYHHGMAEIPYDKTFRGIFRRHVPVEAHLVAVQAPFHRSYLDCCRGLATLSHFLTLCAVSATLIEAVRLALMTRGAQGSVVAGTSLGGFVTLVHHLTFGTANCYAPLLAGPDLAHTLLATHYRRFLARQAGAQPARLQVCLDFRQPFAASDTQRIFPLLARYDLCMPYAYHQAAYAASGVPVVTIDRGHITGALAFLALRTHLLACLRTLTPTAPSGGGA